MVLLTTFIYIIKDCPSETAQHFFEVLEVVLANSSQIQSQTQIVASFRGPQCIEDQILY